MRVTPTFSAEKRNLSESSFPQSEDTYVVSVDPVETMNGNGSKTISVGFPVLAISGWVSDPKDVAELIAKLLTNHYKLENLE